jgi:hypothetical protein
MSYAIAVFDRLTFAVRPELCRLQGWRGQASEYVSSDYDLVTGAAVVASRSLSLDALVAVFRVGDCAEALSGRVPASGLVASYGSPCFVPIGCEALVTNGGPLGRVVSPAEPAPEPACVGFARAVPAPEADRWPLAYAPADCIRSYVLEDGTQCRLVSSGSGERYIEGEGWWPRPYLNVELATASDGLTAGIAWSYWESDGVFVGDFATNRPRLCNAVWSEPAPEPAPEPAARFEVRSGLNGTDRGLWGTVAEFDSGKAAGAWVAAHKSAYAANGKSLAIVKVELEAVPAVDWRAREQARLDDGTYTPLPGDWAYMIQRAYPDHFAHLASSDKRKVAFTESEGSGERDKQKVLSAAEYVSRYFTNPGWGADNWSRTSRAAFVADLLGSSLVPLITPLGDKSAMIRAYRACEGGNAHGCMSYGASQYSTGGIHPVVPYALGGELSVALLLSDENGAIDPDATLDDIGDSDRSVLARCLVWIKDGANLEYGRVYGDTGEARALRTSLEALGFVQGDCCGARIAKVDAPYGDYVMPYLDIGCGTVEDCGDYFCAGGDIDAQRTDGLLGQPRAVCQHCDETYDPEESGSQVRTGRHSWEDWCDSCVNSDAFYCEFSDEYVSDYHAVTFVTSGGHSMTVADWLLENGTVEAVQCEDGVWHEDGFVCEDCSKAFPRDELNVWDDRETSDSSHSEGDCLCSDCYSEREAMMSEPELDLDTSAPAVGAAA